MGIWQYHNTQYRMQSDVYYYVFLGVFLGICLKNSVDIAKIKMKIEQMIKKRGKHKK